MPKHITISTAIAYPNARPHLGHALEFVQADALARFYRLSGYEVMLTTGTDEHGTKMYKTAKDDGITPKELVDRNVVYFRDMCDLLHISHTLFLRTSDTLLKEGAQKLWARLVEAGDIYKAEYEGLYCSGCENYMAEKDLTDGLCPNHKRAPEALKEENYFFRLSKYIPQVKKHIEAGALKIKGEFRAQEILNMLADLGDISFSRPKSVLPWGVEVPNDPDHVMYVWCDALSNYLTGLDYVNEGKNYETFWPTTINIIGKDIMKFHAVLWPAMLMSARLTLPERLYVHGFVTSEGVKMSKSLGNVADPVEYAKNYGADALRYYLLSQIPTQDDGDFSKDRFLEVYSAHLAHNIGNLVSRVAAMVGKYFEGALTRKAGGEKSIFSYEFFEEEFDMYTKAFEDYDLKRATERVLTLAEYANKFVDDSKPWALAKADETAELAYTLYHLLEVIRIMATMLLPIIPEKAAAIFESLGVEVPDSFNHLFEPVEKYGVKKDAVLFPMIEAQKEAA